jgi:GT2 family glycosyltransferase
MNQPNVTVTPPVDLQPGDTGEPRVAVILVNYNGAALTQECVASLRASDFKNLKIVVVDNGSRPADQALLNRMATGLSQVVVLPLGVNAGFARGNNAGMEWAVREFQAEYLWVLNNDTEVRPDAIRLMVQAFAMHRLDRANTILSSIITYADHDGVWCNGLRDLRWANFPRAVDKGIPAGQIARPGLVLQRAQYCVGCSMFFSRELLARHGMMSEDFFMYYEDLDFSRGRENLHLQQPLVRHKVSASAGNKGSARFTPFQAFLFAKNGIHYYFRKKKIPWYEKLIYLGFTNWVFVVLYVRDWRTFRAHCGGLWEGLTKPGKPFQPT